MRALLAPLLLLVMLLPAQAEERILHRFTLEHRAPHALVPALQAILNEGDRISVVDNQLLIRSDLYTVAELQALIDELDHPSQALRATLRQTRYLERNGESVIRYGTAPVADDELQQQLRISEGQWSRLTFGREIPLGKQTTQVGPGGMSTQQSIEYKQLQSGFNIRVTLLGDNRISVEVHPFLQEPSPTGGGVIKTQQMTTTTVGRLGEWLELGGPVERGAEAPGTTRYSTRIKSRQGRRVLLKIDRLQP